MSKSHCQQGCSWTHESQPCVDSQTSTGNSRGGAAESVLPLSPFPGHAYHLPSATLQPLLWEGILQQQAVETRSRAGVSHPAEPTCILHDIDPSPALAWGQSPTPLLERGLLASASCWPHPQTYSPQPGSHSPGSEPGRGRDSGRKERGLWVEMVGEDRGSTPPGDTVAGDRRQLWVSRTHDGGAERVEGVGPTGIEVGAVQPLQEPHVVEALGLQRGRAGVTSQEKRGQPLPGTHPAALPCCFCPSAGSPSFSPGRLPSGSARGRETATA